MDSQSTREENLPSIEEQQIAKPEMSMRQVIEEWARKPKIYLTPEELVVCQKNPAEATTIRGPELVPCSR